MVASWRPRTGAVSGTRKRLRLFRPSCSDARTPAWDGREVTDDGALVEMAGGTVVMVEGSTTNLKVTRPEDLVVAEAFLDMYGSARSAQGV